MGRLNDEIKCTERDFLWEQIGALKAQVAVYREWLASLGAIEKPKVLRFHDCKIVDLDKEDKK